MFSYRCWCLFSDIRSSIRAWLVWWLWCHLTRQWVVFACSFAAGLVESDRWRFPKTGGCRSAPGWIALRRVVGICRVREKGWCRGTWIGVCKCGNPDPCSIGRWWKAVRFRECSRFGELRGYFNKLAGKSPIYNSFLWLGIHFVEWKMCPAR